MGNTNGKKREGETERGSRTVTAAVAVAVAVTAARKMRPCVKTLFLQGEGNGNDKLVAHFFGCDLIKVFFSQDYHKFSLSTFLYPLSLSPLFLSPSLCLSVCTYIYAI